MKIYEDQNLKILDFDIENRPLSYLGQDFTTGEITAIACGWIGQKKVYCWLLGEVSYKELLSSFVAMYDEADMVTGHYIRKHDLPVINGALLELGMKPLSQKLSSDTKMDLIKSKYLSMSQESLSGVLGIKAGKQHMTQPDWREANRLTAAGLRKTKKRVCSDVETHRQMRELLIKRGLLKPPKLWRP